MGLPTALSFREKVEFLGSLDIFSRLEIKDLVKIAAISKQYGFDTGKVFIHQGDVADKLYIVHSGRLEAVSINDEGVSRRERLYLPNQLFEDSWLFNPSAHSSSIKARQGGLLIIISSSDFLRMLDRPENKHIGTILNLTDEGREEYIKSPLARSERRYKSINLVPGELVEFETKRSRWVLFGKMILPTIGLLTVPLATYIFLPQFFPNLSFNWTLGIVGIFLFIFGFYAWFEWYDWANDYLIITNKRLVHYEFELRSFSGRGQDTNISQVQSVESVRPNIISNILQVGTARVTTSALSVLYFDFLPQPEKIQETISRIQRRQGTMSAGQEKATMRRSVENYFKIPEMLFKLEEEPPPRPPETAWERFQKQWASLPLYRYRTEEGDMITYRKHVFALFIETVWPAGFMVLLGLVLIGLSFFGADQYAGIVVVIMILDGLWFIW
ncbi:MAG: cyclic nucleotide-binding domain-containing protein, partial [Chloroflexota bacterium]